jgi:beta-glucosidase
MGRIDVAATNQSTASEFDRTNGPGEKVSRRAVLVTGALGLGAPVATGKARAAPKARTPGDRSAPEGFWWGTAISAHQSEGNNINSDSWLNETVTPSVFREPSGDACDSYNRFNEDIALAGRLGFNCHRLGVEWARIEPEPGVFSIAELDHYQRVLEACHAHGLAPMVTLNHFTVPRWFAARGGFERADGADLFARFAERTGERLGSLMAAATTFNEANIARLVQSLPNAVKTRPIALQMLASSARASGSDRFSSILFSDPDKTEPVMLEAHRRAYQALKAGPGTFPVGVSMSMQEIQSVDDGEPLARAIRDGLYKRWLDAAAASDFIGVQTYTRVRVAKSGVLPPPQGVELTDAGYEFYPPALGAMIRYAAQETKKPVYVTESGISTKNDARRVAFINQGLAEVRQCLDEGIDVRSYIHWSLLDNFEWTSGFDQQFGLVAVDRSTFARTPKPSASHLGRLAKQNRLA